MEEESKKRIYELNTTTCTEKTLKELQFIP